MCNRYRMSAKQVEVARRFGIPERFIMPEPERLPPPELFPKRDGWVVRKENGERVLDVMTWGFPPPAAGRAPVTNVRNLASPFWRGALKSPRWRCLVPVTDFCEWSGEKGSKQEHWFSVPSHEIFAFAGIWRPTEAGNAYAFLTCEPNPLVEPIHPKAMPVILQPEDYDRWLDGEVDEACALAAPFPSQLMSVA
jgi:putative SOS response-associated peptidase YedK